MIYILDPEARDRVAALYAHVGEIVVLMDAHAAEAANIAGRRGALAELLDATDQAKPDETVNAADDLAVALAADPSVVTRKGWLARLKIGQATVAESLAEWRGRRDVLVRAIAKVEGEAAQNAEAVAQLEESRVAAWDAFSLAAREAIGAEIVERFSAFYDEAFAPFVALWAMERTRAPGQVNFTPESTLLVDRLRENRATGGYIADWERLFPKPAETHPAAIEAFCAWLSA
ncbi:MAG: hypothetical protein JO290_08560 [Sphingomonadaceae bacterium]|nr:hypothetical protein [Sphingomonadaceae bacterium]